MAKEFAHYVVFSIANRMGCMRMWTGLEAITKFEHYESCADIISQSLKVDVDLVVVQSATRIPGDDRDETVIQLVKNSVVTPFR